MNTLRLAIPVFLLFCWTGCKKDSGVAYDALVKFRTFSDRWTWILTDSGGAERARTTIVRNSLGKLQTLTTTSGTLDYHLINVDTTLIGGNTVIRIFAHSYLHIPGGGTVLHEPLPADQHFSDAAQFNCTVSGLPPLDTFVLAGTRYVVEQKSYDRAGGHLQIRGYRDINAPFYLRVRPQGNPNFHYVFLTGDTAQYRRLRWSDFRPETNFKDLELPAGSIPLETTVYAVSKDRRLLHPLLHHDDAALLPAGKTPTAFHLPENLNPAEWQLRVFVRTTDFAVEKMFALDENLRIGPPAVRITRWDGQPGEPIRITTEGNPNLIRLWSFWDMTTSAGQGLQIFQINWQFYGTPENFADYRAPDFSALFPTLWKKMTAEKPSSQWAFAYHFKDKNYAQLIAGDWSASVPFPLAESGYHVQFRSR